MYIRPKRTLHDLMWRYRKRRRRNSENDGVTESINAADVRERRSDGVCGERKEMKGRRWDRRRIDFLGFTENRRKEALERKRERES